MNWEWNWGLALLMLGLGIGVGLILNWRLSPRSNRIRELEEELDATRSELTTYRNQVNQHFQATAVLFEDMTERYRAMYQHLASSAQSLCGERPVNIKLDLNDTARLVNTPAAEASKPETTVKPTGSASTAVAGDDDDYLGDAPHIPELTDEVDTPVASNPEKTPPAAAP